MVDAVARMLRQIEPLQRPPLERWQPALSGDIDILIDEGGQWFHDGALVTRQPLIRLFASILRFEPSIGYVLVTPQEKWRITVADAPFVATALATREQGGQPTLCFVTNVGEEVVLDENHPLYLACSASAHACSNGANGANGDAAEISSASAALKPYIVVRDHLSARLSRPVYYELVDGAVEHAGQFGVWSGHHFFPLC